MNRQVLFIPAWLLILVINLSEQWEDPSPEVSFSGHTLLHSLLQRRACANLATPLMTESTDRVWIGELFIIPKLSNCNQSLSAVRSFPSFSLKDLSSFAISHHPIFLTQIYKNSSAPHEYHVLSIQPFLRDQLSRLRTKDEDAKTTRYLDFTDIYPTFLEWSAGRIGPKCPTCVFSSAQLL